MNQDESNTDNPQQQSNEHQFEINFNYDFLSSEDSSNHPIQLLDQNEEITFRYEHHRSQTFAHFVHSSNSKESLDYSSSSVCTESDDDHHRKFPRQIHEEDFQAKIIPDPTPSIVYDDEHDQKEAHQSKSGKLFRRQFSKCLSSTTNDLHSLFKKLSCLKRISSLVDLNHHKTAETLLKKKPLRLTYQNGKTLTKSDIIHCQPFDSKPIQESNDAQQQQQQQPPLIVPKFHIEVSGSLQIQN